MAHFYGTLNGSRGEASRCGDKGSGFVAVAASWAGAIRTELFIDAQGRDSFRVLEVEWEGKGQRRLLAEGVLGGVPVPGKYATAI